MQECNGAYAAIVRQILSDILGGYCRYDYAIRLWDGSHWFPPSAKDGTNRSFTLVLSHPGSLRNMFDRASMLSLGQEFLSGSFDVEGNLFAACELGDYLLRLKPSLRRRIKLALRIRKLPKGPTPSEGRARCNLSGSVGSRSRLREAIAYHYDLPVDFWKLWLDSSLAYSCAYFKNGAESLDDAQANKLDYVCRKLYLSQGERLLDLGCGWGGLVTFAACHYGVKATGITLSRTQAEYGSHLVRQLGLQRQCEIIHLDFRDFRCAERFDKIACVGAIEHVPVRDLNAFFEHVARLLKPGGLFLNHGITESASENHPSGPSFVDAFVFPDHGVTTLSCQLKAAEESGFEVRDVECLREHYMRTCSEWLKRIEENEVGLTRHSNRPTQRLFRLYVAGQAYYFKTGASSIHQMLLVRSESKPAHLPLTRASWYRSG
ncbi:MAG TPA: cyclopropane-fatty-acyl-phospholipid synthase family protein [Candidatus Angelobacter sp.]